MPSGLSPYWILTWSLWSVVVYLDRRREPRDWRWVVSLGAMIAVALITRGSLNEPNLRFVLLSGLATVVILTWGISSLRTKRRGLRTKAWAIDHVFVPLVPNEQPAETTLPDDLRRLPIFSRGSYAKTEGLMEREEADGGKTLVFQHSVRRQMAWYGSAGVEARGTAVAIYRPDCALPLFQIRPDGLFPWVDGGTFGERVAVSPQGRFANAYRLLGDEPRNLRALFGEPLLASISERAGWILQGEGRWVVAFYFDRSENLMSLKTSTLRVVNHTNLADHVDQTVALLRSIAEAASRGATRDLGVA